MLILCLLYILCGMWNNKNTIIILCFYCTLSFSHLVRDLSEPSAQHCESGGWFPHSFDEEIEARLVT